MVQAKGIFIIPFAYFLWMLFGDYDGHSFYAYWFPQSWNFQLGANAILAVSLAVCKAGALAKKLPLYKVCVV